MPNLIDLLVILFGAGGVLGGIVALIKATPEASRISVGAAEGAVLVQGKVIQDLREEVTRLATDKDKVTQELREEVTRIAIDNERCRKRENEMEIQVDILERRVTDLERRVLDLGGTLS